MFNDVSRKRMPQLFTAKIQTKLLKNKDQFKSWWYHLTQKSNTPSSSASSHSTLDWRSLSPDRPPLPFFLPESPTSSTTSIDTTNNRSIITPALYPTNTTLIDNNTTLDIEPKRYHNAKNTNNNNTSNNSKVNITLLFYIIHVLYLQNTHAMIILATFYNMHYILHYLTSYKFFWKGRTCNISTGRTVSESH